MSDWPQFSAVGRHLFLRQTLRLYPGLWRSLQEVCQTRDNARAVRWLNDRGIVDDWFIRVINDTLIEWTRNPESPGARLEPGTLWFSYCEPIEEIPDFRPGFLKPYPTYTSPGLDAARLAGYVMRLSGTELREFTVACPIEPLEGFAKRMREQFERELQDYLANVARVFDYGSSPELWDHAGMTVYRFAGVSKAEIARNWSPQHSGMTSERGGLRTVESILEVKHRVKDASSAVSKAIDRFAGRIGLTLRKGRQDSREGRHFDVPLT